MGITGNCFRLLSHAAKLGVDYHKTLMLGRQQLFFSESERNSIASKLKPRDGGWDLSQYAEPLFQAMGARQVDSMDYSDFEKATLIHDLNDPVNDSWKNQYTLVFDGGTLEHVFNFPIAIKNAMDMLTVSGHFIALTPANNFCGHGFYQFSPELFFSVFSETHGFKTKLVAIGAERPEGGEEWFEVQDPKAVRERVIITNSFPTSLFVVAEKIHSQTTALHPFQSDYAYQWKVHNAKTGSGPGPDDPRWLTAYRKWFPEFLRSYIRRLRGGGQHKIVEGLGDVNQSFFRKLEI